MSVRQLNDGESMPKKKEAYIKVNTKEGETEQKKKTSPHWYQQAPDLLAQEGDQPNYWKNLHERDFCQEMVMKAIRSGKH